MELSGGSLADKIKLCGNQRASMPLTHGMVH
jgi:hypothetical protein